MNQFYDMNVKHNLINSNSNNSKKAHAEELVKVEH